MLLAVACDWLEGDYTSFNFFFNSKLQNQYLSLTDKLSTQLFIEVLSNSPKQKLEEYNLSFNIFASMIWFYPVKACTGFKRMFFCRIKAQFCKLIILLSFYAYVQIF